MHSQSRKWINPKVEKEAKLRRYNTARNKLCKDSYAWPLNYDFDEHHKLYKDDLRAHLQKNEDRRVKDLKARLLQGLSAIPSTDVNEAMGGKVFGDNRSAVLGEETVFTHEFEANRTEREETNNQIVCKEVADWPCREEAKYEGDDRVFTERIHGRFLGLPRVPGNETVNWMQRSVVNQYPFDDFYLKPTAHEVFWRYYSVEDIEINHDTGCHLIGDELMGMLDE